MQPLATDIVLFYVDSLHGSEVTTLTGDEANFTKLSVYLEVSIGTCIVCGHHGPIGKDRHLPWG